eukprot:m.19839 g.19839  ORF g.19839 m.19839 type:complete len:119 (+) comp8506_c0_seq1:127-483(+)
MGRNPQPSHLKGAHDGQFLCVWLKTATTRQQPLCQKSQGVRSDSERTAVTHIAYHDHRAIGAYTLSSKRVPFVWKRPQVKCKQDAHNPSDSATSTLGQEETKYAIHSAGPTWIREFKM